MTTRERLSTVFAGGRPDRIPDVEFGYWDETLVRWHDEGLPREITSDASAETYFGLEGVTMFAEVPVINGIYPRFEREILEEKGDRTVIRDEEGNTCEVLVGKSSMPRYIRFGLQTRADWERLKRERLDPETPGRIGNVCGARATAVESGSPFVINAGSLYGWLRNWMGVEGFSYALMTERSWVEEMMDHLILLTTALFERVLPQAQVDIAWWWEDMCYNHGPLLSPAMFREMMVPRYREVTRLLAQYGVKTNVLDCDGRINELVPGWLDAGIDCMFPLEAAHTDAFLLRETYGDSLLMLGGVDKRALIAGKEEIDRELDRLAPLVARGRYIPCVDHRVPADVTFAHYQYYLEKKKAMLHV